MQIPGAQNGACSSLFIKQHFQNVKAKPRISQPENAGNNLGFHCLLLRNALFHKDLITEDY